MCHDLEAIVERAVVLAVGIVGGTVRDGEDCVCPIGGFAGIVYLELYAEVARRVTVKHRIRFVVVRVDRIRIAWGAVVAVWAVVIVGIVRVVLVDDASALGAAQVVVVVAGFAERRVVIAGVVVAPDSEATVVADDGVCVEACVAEQRFIHLVQLGQRVDAAADGTGQGLGRGWFERDGVGVLGQDDFGHVYYLQSIKIARSVALRASWG